MVWSARLCALIAATAAAATTSAIADSPCCAGRVRLVTTYNASCRTLCNDDIRCGGYAYTHKKQCYMCDPAATDFSSSTCRLEYDAREQFTHDKPCNSLMQCLVCGNKTNSMGLQASTAPTTAAYLSKTCVYLDPGGTHTLDIELHRAQRAVVHGGGGNFVGSLTASCPLTVYNLLMAQPLRYTGSDLVAVDLHSDAPAAIVITYTDTVASITNVRGAVAAVALGFVTGTITVVCAADGGINTARQAVVVQSAKHAAATKLSISSGCMNVNLGTLLGVYGDDYELEYVHANDVLGADYYVGVAVQWMLTFNVVFVVAALLIYDKIWTVLALKYAAKKKA